MVHTPHEGPKLTRRQLVSRGAGLGLTVIPLLASGAQAKMSVAGADSSAATYYDTSRFQDVWAATDQAVADGSVSRTWIWGPAPISQQQEPYTEAPGGQHTVIYYDKARMEENGYRASAPWDVTTGLLAKDLILGQRQTGDTTFEQRAPAEINIAGDQDDLNGPVYRSFKSLLAYDPIPVGWTITQTVDRAGHVGTDSSLASHGVTTAKLVSETNHTVASVFTAFLDTYSAQSHGNTYYLTGFPITEPYWTTVKVGGVAKQVLAQAFERRVLTYTPDNPSGWQVEMGNVGQHYYQWVSATASLRELAVANGLTIGTFDVLGAATEFPYVQTMDLIASQSIMASSFDTRTVFGNFTSAGWQTVVTSWDSISKDLDNGTVPEHFNYFWDWADGSLAFAQREGRTTRVQHLLWGSEDVLDSVYTGGFTADELRKILEFMVKTRVIRYRGQINEWDAGDEASSNILFGNSRQHFWYDQLGETVIDDVCRWAFAADPSVKLVFVVTNILEPPSVLQQQLYDKFLAFLKHFREANVPMHKAAPENNLWIYARPTKEDMISKLRAIRDLGYEIASSETTVSISDDPPPWYMHPTKINNVTDKLQAQADLYADLYDAYLTVGADFGVANVSDKESWLNDVGRSDTKAMLFDDN